MWNIPPGLQISPDLRLPDDLHSILIDVLASSETATMIAADNKDLKGVASHRAAVPGGDARTNLVKRRALLFGALFGARIRNGDTAQAPRSY